MSIRKHAPGASAGTVPDETPSVSWGGVFAGTIIALAVVFTASVFWTALGYGSAISWSTGVGFGWLMAGSALVAVCVGAFVATWTARTGGSQAAGLTGTVVWGLFFLALAAPFGLLPLARLAGLAPSPAVTAPQFGNSAWLLFGALIVSLPSAWISAGMGLSARLSRMSRRGMPAASPASVPPHEHRGGRVIQAGDGAPTVPSGGAA